MKKTLNKKSRIHVVNMHKQDIMHRNNNAPFVDNERKIL